MQGLTYAPSAGGLRSRPDAMEKIVYTFTPMYYYDSHPWRPQFWPYNTKPLSFRRTRAVGYIILPLEVFYIVCEEGRATGSG